MNNHYGWGLPISISEQGNSIDQLIILVHFIIVILFLGWLTFFIFSLIRFRKPVAQSKPIAKKSFRIPIFLEIGVFATELILLFAFSIPIMSRYAYNPNLGNEALRIRVVAEQFTWNIHYPGPDGKFGKTSLNQIDIDNPLGLNSSDIATKDDIVVLNNLTIPVNTPIELELSSKDVIHGFGITVMRIKQDIIPGQTSKIRLEANQIGEFQISCVQLCGLGHYRMKGAFNVVESNDFAVWLEEQI